jgi:hypothetical protein
MRTSSLEAPRKSFLSAPQCLPPILDVGLALWKLTVPSGLRRVPSPKTVFDDCIFAAKIEKRVIENQ